MAKLRAAPDDPTPPAWVLTFDRLEWLDRSERLDPALVVAFGAPGVVRRPWRPFPGSSAAGGGVLMAVLRVREPDLLHAGGVPAELLSWASPCWHRGAGDWAPGFIAAGDAWAVGAGIVLPDGGPDWRRLRSEFGIVRPRILRRWHA